MPYPLGHGGNQPDIRKILWQNRTLFKSGWFWTTSSSSSECLHIVSPTWARDVICRGKRRRVKPWVYSATLGRWPWDGGGATGRPPLLMPSTAAATVSPLITGLKLLLSVGYETWPPVGCHGWCHPIVKCTLGDTFVAKHSKLRRFERPLTTPLHHPQASLTWDICLPSGLCEQAVKESMGTGSSLHCVNDPLMASCTMIAKTETEMFLFWWKFSSLTAPEVEKMHNVIFDVIMTLLLCHVCAGKMLTSNCWVSRRFQSLMTSVEICETFTN